MQRLKYYFIGFLSMVLPSLPMASEPPLVIDRIGSETVIGKNFRRHLSPELPASASGQFSADELQRLFKYIPRENRDIWIIDLRQESHGFLNGMAVSWYGDFNSANVGKSPAEIYQLERKMLKRLSCQNEVKVFHLQKCVDGEVATSNYEIIKPQLVLSEEELVERLGANYKRFYVLDHNRPNDQMVDHFVEFVRTSVTDNSWLHFHCRGGKGRSSTFIAMYDMLLNARNDSFATIMERQVKMGNKDLAAASNKASKAWKQPQSKERYEFLQNFYKYAATAFPDIKWSDWATQP